MSNPIRKNDVVTRRIERLTRSKEFTGKFRLHKLRTAAVCAVSDEHGVAHNTFLVALRLAERAVVNPQFRKRFSRTELKFVDDEIMFVRNRKIGAFHTQRDSRNERRQSENTPNIRRGRHKPILTPMRSGASDIRHEGSALAARIVCRTVTECRYF